jgi:hypothetical protein
VRGRGAIVPRSAQAKPVSIRVQIDLHDDSVDRDARRPAAAGVRHPDEAGGLQLGRTSRWRTSRSAGGSPGSRAAWGLKNVFLRIAQARRADDDEFCLSLARDIVATKVREPADTPPAQLIADSAVLSALNTRMVTPKDFNQTGRAVAMTAAGRKGLLRAYEAADGQSRHAPAVRVSGQLPARAGAAGATAGARGDRRAAAGPH